MREALKMALEAFEAIPEEIEGWIPDKCTDAVIAIKEALAQPEQEFVAYIDMSEWPPVRFKEGTLRCDIAHLDGQKLYTTPPQRTWVGLDEEDDIDWEEGGSLRDLVEAVEAKLKEKNI